MPTDEPYTTGKAQVKSNFDEFMRTCESRACPSPVLHVRCVFWQRCRGPRSLSGRKLRLDREAYPERGRLASCRPHQGSGLRYSDRSQRRWGEASDVVDAGATPRSTMCAMRASLYAKPPIIDLHPFSIRQRARTSQASRLSSPPLQPNPAGLAPLSQPDAVEKRYPESLSSYRANGALSGFAEV